MSEKKVSSGADKAEKLTKKNTQPEEKANNTVKSRQTAGKAKPQQTKTETAKSNKTQAAQDAKPKTTKKQQSKPDAKEKRKLETAKLREEKREKRLQRKLERKEKNAERVAAFKNKRLERREKRLQRKDQLKHETSEMRIKRKEKERAAKIEAAKARREARLNAKIARREHKLKVRAERAKRREGRQRTPGFGGWLAAVIALGVTTLALGTMLTFGWMNFNGVQAQMTASATHSLYELNAIVDNIDANLSKARVSSSAGEQARILTDIAIESGLAENRIEELPVAGRLTQSLTSFVNKMGDSAQSMLYTVADGKALTDSQIATIEYMYKSNKEVKTILNELTGNCCEKDVLKAIQKHEGVMFDSFDKITNISVETPKEIYDGPFAEQTEKVSAKNLDGLEEVTSSEAEELAKKYFADYNITEARCTGETTAQQLTVYNVELTADGDEYFTQISKAGGKVVMFDSFKECHDNNFDADNCIAIAQNMLESLGYSGMQAVWVSESGTTCNLNFAYMQGGVVVYPDMVKVKVCEERGIVTGIEALSYVLNHIDRDIESASLTKTEAQGKINSGVEVTASRLALIPKDGGERLSYEFYGTYDGSSYYIYIDAQTGAELDVFTVIGTAQGKALI